MQRLVAVVALMAASAPLDAASAHRFDPKTYIQATQNPSPLEGAPKLTSKSIFRVDGRRYQKLMTPDGAVFLPTTGDKLEVIEEFALCQHHMKLMREVIPLREGLGIEDGLRQDEDKIVAMIEKCKEGKIKGPTLVVDRPDGSRVEVRAKEDEE